MATIVQGLQRRYGKSVLVARATATFLSWSAAIRQPGHALDHEAFPWLARAATGDCVTQRVLRTLAELPSHEQVVAEHEPTCFLRSPQIRYGRARGLFMIGRLDQAELEFEFVRGEPAYTAAATECLSAIAKRRGADTRWNGLRRVALRSS